MCLLKLRVLWMRGAFGGNSRPIWSSSSSLVDPVVMAAQVAHTSQVSTAMSMKSTRRRLERRALSRFGRKPLMACGPGVGSQESLRSRGPEEAARNGTIDAIIEEIWIAARVKCVVGRLRTARQPPPLHYSRQREQGGHWNEQERNEIVPWIQWIAGKRGLMGDGVPRRGMSVKVLPEVTA